MLSLQPMRMAFERSSFIFLVSSALATTCFYHFLVVESEGYFPEGGKRPQSFFKNKIDKILLIKRRARNQVDLSPDLLAKLSEPNPVSPTTSIST